MKNNIHKPLFKVKIQYDIYKQYIRHPRRLPLVLRNLICIVLILLIIFLIIWPYFIFLYLLNACWAIDLKIKVLKN